MSDAAPLRPWVLQNVALDRKLERFRVALEKIAAHKPDMDRPAPDQQLVILQEVTTIARTALDQEE
jgi:hypothetical protein